MAINYNSHSLKVIYMTKYLLVLFFIFNSAFCQYSIDDYQLVKTTFQREFDKTILHNYLFSSTTAKIKAGLLSVSHSDDTTFVDDIIKLDFEKHGDYICFALGQIGPCEKSLNYLIAKLNSIKRNLYRRDIFEAIGKVCNKRIIDSLVTAYFQSPIDKCDGISLALANYNFREKLTGYNEVQKLLKNEFTSLKIPINRRIDALYSLNRIGPSINLKDDLYRILDENELNEKSMILKQYTLACLQKLKTFPNDYSKLQKFLRNRDWRFRTETVKTACYFPFNSINEIDSYLNLLSDKNPNVTRQTAISLKNISLKDSLLIKKFKDRLNQIFRNNNMTGNTFGEYYISYMQLFPSSFENTYPNSLNKIKRTYLYQALLNSKIDSLTKFSTLLEKLSPINKSDEIDFALALIELQKQLLGNEDFENLLISELNSSYSPVVNIIADELDSGIVVKSKEKIKDIVLKQVGKQLRNYYFFEGLSSLVKLSQKLDSMFYNKVLKNILESNIPEIKNIAIDKMEVKPSRKFNKFDEFWKNSFLYKGARVQTDKGAFTFYFAPEYSPITVGNFCSLVKSGFYKNLVFHRVVPNFVIQTGDPDSTGWGGPGYSISSEFSLLPYDEGYIGMASSGKDTEGSQWFVMHGSFHHLNGRYTNFGRIINGQNAVDLIDQGDKINRIELIPKD